MKEVEKRLEQLTTDFLGQFYQLYREHDEKASDSYIRSYALSKALNAAMPFSPDTAFYNPLCGSGFPIEFIKGCFEKHTQDIPKKVEWLFANRELINEQSEFTFYDVEEGEYDSEDIVYPDPNNLAKFKFVKCKEKKITFKTKYSRNNCKLTVVLYYQKKYKKGGIYLDKISVSNDERMQPFCIFKCNQIDAKVKTEVGFLGDSCIPDTNHFCMMVQSLYDEFNNDEKETEN